MIAGLMLMVVLLVALWKVIILLAPSASGSWFSRFTQTQGTYDPEDEEDQGNGRRTLAYENGGGRYLDQPPVAAEEVDESEDGRAEDSALVGSRVQPSQLRDDSEQWANERHT